MRRMRIPCHGFTILYDFMLTCTDELFQRWRTGTHFVFHTLKRTPTNVGNLVCMDEYVGEHRVKFQAVVNHLVPNQEILWQLRKCGVLWPVWLRLQLTGTPAGVHIVHTLLEQDFPGLAVFSMGCCGATCLQSSSSKWQPMQMLSLRNYETSFVNQKWQSGKHARRAFHRLRRFQRHLHGPGASLRSNPVTGKG